MMDWGETFQSWRNEIPSVTAQNGLFIAPNVFGTPFTHAIVLLKVRHTEVSELAL